MRLPESLLEKLDIAAEEDGRSRTALVAKILAEWLKKNGYSK